MSLNLTKENKLGKGVTGQVYKTQDGRYAYKKYFFEGEECFSDDSIKEVSILKTLKGTDYIISSEKEIFVQKDNGFFMKLHPSTLGWRIKKSLIEPELAQKFLYQILVALYYAHEKFIIHGDVKPDNILIDQNNEIVLADWGHSVIDTFKNKDPKSLLVQSLWYKAPEVLLGNKQFTSKIDIWSAGIVYHQMITQKLLARGEDDLDQFTKITSIFGTPDEYTWPGVSNLSNYEKYTKNNNSKGYFFPTTGDDICDNLLQNMLMLNPDDRFSVIDCLNHEFFDSIRDREFFPFSNITNINKIGDIFIDHDILKTKRFRKAVIKWIFSVCNALKHDEATYFSAITYFDYMISCCSNVNPQLLAIGSIYLACLFVETWPSPMHDFVIVSGKFKEEEICAKAYEIYNQMDHNLYIPTFVMYINELSQYANINDEMKSEVLQLLMSAVENVNYLMHNKLVLCLAAMHLSLNIDDLSELMEYSGVKDINALKSAVDFLSEFKKN